MGWFLISKKKKNNKRKAAGKKAWDPGQTAKVLKTTAWLVVLVGIGVAWVWGEPRLRHVVAVKQPARVKVDLKGLPAWMPEQVAGELRLLVSASVSADPFDQASLSEVGRRLAANPWVLRVHRVVRLSGGSVEVSAEYRRHAALVWSREGYILVDSDCVRLPFVYRHEETQNLGLPHVHGVRTDAPPVGQPWQGQDLRDGLALATVLHAQPWSRMVRAIDVSNHDGRLNPQRAHLKALTALDEDKDPFNNAGIEWGRLPGEGRFEPDAAWKLARIEQEIRKHQRLDDRVISLISEPGITYPTTLTPEALAEAHQVSSPSAQGDRRSLR